MIADDVSDDVEAGEAENDDGVRQKYNFRNNTAEKLNNVISAFL